MAWDDNKKTLAVKMYLDREPTPENSVEIVKEIADEIGESANGVRMILSKATREDGSPVYVKKEAPKASSSAAKSSGATGGSTRVSKEAAHAKLVEAIEAHGQTADSEIISKMTGKAAMHFAEVFAAIPRAE